MKKYKLLQNNKITNTNSWGYNSSLSLEQFRLKYNEIVEKELSVKDIFLDLNLNYNNMKFQPFKEWCNKLFGKNQAAEIIEKRFNLGE